MATITLQSLAIGYRHGRTLTTIAAGINATLKPGRLTCLLGANGAGKSTLLRTLSGFMPPLEGEVSIGGTPVGAFTQARLSRTVSVVLTHPVDTTALTVNGLVSLGRSPYTGFFGHMSARDREVVSWALDMAGIADKAHRLVDTLSDGERQKALIAKSLAQETPVILLDEPTAFLDYPGKLEIMLLLRDLAHGQQRTVLLSTHDLQLALQLADDIWLMDKELGFHAGSVQATVNQEILTRYFRHPSLQFDPLTRTFTVRG